MTSSFHFIFFCRQNHDSNQICWEGCGRAALIRDFATQSSSFDIRQSLWISPRANLAVVFIFITLFSFSFSNKSRQTRFSFSSREIFATQKNSRKEINFIRTTTSLENPRPQQALYLHRFPWTTAFCLATFPQRFSFLFGDFQVVSYHRRLCLVKFMKNDDNPVREEAI